MSHWPDARGVFKNHDDNVTVWINEEDHLKLFCIENSADIGNCYTNVVNFLTKIDKEAEKQKIKFADTKTLGYLLSLFFFF